MNEILPIVGIGASAGGLEALDTFFTSMPTNNNMAFVVVMHLDPSHVSLLPELLQRQTKMDVVKITDCVRIEANRIYVIPPNKNLSIINRELRLEERSDLRIKLPIDYFFKMLAQDQGSNAICVILSGTGSDGSLGLQEIKAESGMVMVQSPLSAKYDSMPKNAIATGLADFILPPDEMPQCLIKYIKNIHPNDSSNENNTAISNNILHEILVLIRNQIGHDFSLYKKKTIYRRIERRMHVHQIKNIKDYLSFIQKDNHEITILFRDLLIGVTSFFRDKEAFDVLMNSIIPELLLKKPDNYTIRVWIPGCSSGQEAYSIAIALLECIEKSKSNINIQIFGTDIDEYAIDHARSGVYPDTIISEIGEKYCKKYFTKEGNKYRINKSLRDMLVFATQNLIKDPPFSKIDLICCRNLLIYFGPELQKNILPIFHYSLKDDGILFLGPSETTGQSNLYFEIIDKKWKLFKRKYKKKTTTSSLHFSDPMSSLKMNRINLPATTTQIEEFSALQLVEIILKQSHIAPCVIIDNQHNIIYVHGRLGDYLEPAEGRSSSNILDMARTPELKDILSHSIRKSLLQKNEIQKKSIITGNKEDKKFIDITIKPLPDFSGFKDLLMITFLENVQKKNTENNKETAKDSDLNDDNILRKELESTRENLQTTIEELETSNEELKSSNEELQSTNEELQSTNEELETSKEELQSLNEESVTVNAELQSHIDELSTANDDIKNLLDSTQIATVFLDTELKIRRYTPKMTDIINLLPSDVHRPIDHLSSSLQNIKLSDAAAIVLKTLEKIETEVRDDKNKFYRMRTLPYRTANNVIAGVVMSFEDITKIKDVEIELRESEQRYRSLFDHCPVTIIELDISELKNYIVNNQLISVAQLKSHLKSNKIMDNNIKNLIQVLNINESGLSLFNEPNKKKLLDSLPNIIINHDYIFNQIKIIIEECTNIIFTSKIHTSEKSITNCEITITIPKHVSNERALNSILVIIPETNGREEG